MATDPEEPTDTSMDHGVQKQSAPEEGSAFSNGAAAQLDEGEMSLQVDFYVWRETDHQNPVRQYAWVQSPGSWVVSAHGVAHCILFITPASCGRCVWVQMLLRVAKPIGKDPLRSDTAEAFSSFCGCFKRASPGCKALGAVVMPVAPIDFLQCL